MSKPSHPADRLARGEITCFEAACAAVALACRRELALNLTLIQEELAHTPRDDHFIAWLREWNHDLHQYQQQAERARAVYRDGYREGHAHVAAELRAAGLDDFAAALESGFYSPLAL